MSPVRNVTLHFSCCLCFMNSSCLLQDNFTSRTPGKGLLNPSNLIICTSDQAQEQKVARRSKADLIHKIFGCDEKFYVGPTPPPSHGFGGTTRLVPALGLLVTKLSTLKMVRVRGKSLVFSAIRDQISKVRHQRCRDRNLRYFPWCICRWGEGSLMEASSSGLHARHHSSWKHKASHVLLSSLRKQSNGMLKASEAVTLPHVQLSGCSS